MSIGIWSLALPGQRLSVRFACKGHQRSFGNPRPLAPDHLFAPWPHVLCQPEKAPAILTCERIGIQMVLNLLHAHTELVGCLKDPVGSEVTIQKASDVGDEGLVYVNIAEFLAKPLLVYPATDACHAS